MTEQWQAEQYLTEHEEMMWLEWQRARETFEHFCPMAFDWKGYLEVVNKEKL